MMDSVDYQRAWDGYRQQGKVWIALFLLYVPVIVGAAVLSRKYWHAFWPAIALAVVWMVVTFYLGVRINLWRCPRCGKAFSGSLWRSKGIFARQCEECGLVKYSDGQVPYIERK